MKSFLCFFICLSSLLLFCNAQQYFFTTALSFQSTLNQPLVAVLTTRRQLINAQGPAVVAILLHGQTGNMNSDLLPLLNNQLLDQIPSIDGVLRLDFTGHGASAGAWEYGNYAQEISDLHTCINYLATRGITVYATIGHSMGANIVLLHAHQYPGESPRVVSMSSRYNMTRGIFTNVAGNSIYTTEQMNLLSSQGWFNWYSAGRNMTFNITQASIDERLAVDMNVVSTIPSSVPVLLTHGTKDATIPLEDATALEALIPHSKLVFINGGSHNYDPAGAELDVANEVALFLGGRNATTPTNSNTSTTITTSTTTTGIGGSTTGSDCSSSGIKVMVNGVGYVVLMSVIAIISLIA